jgi:hypothetical protein
MSTIVTAANTMTFGSLNLSNLSSELVDVMRENDEAEWTEEEVPSALGVTEAALRAFNERDVSEAGIVGLMDVGNFLMVPVEELAEIIVGGLEPGERRAALGPNVAERHRGIVDALPPFARGEWSDTALTMQSMCEWGENANALNWLKWWMEKNKSEENDEIETEKNKKKLCCVAVDGGHLAALKWARENGYPWTDTMCWSAASGGHLNILKWAWVNGCVGDSWVCWSAARGGHLETLKWVRANGCPWDEGTCQAAVGGGHLEVLQWARANGCPWDEGTCAVAARSGGLEALQWARANGCPWDNGTCYGAACGGHLEVLQWARANGCPWDHRTCERAAIGGNLDILKWARTNGCPWDKPACVFAAKFLGVEEVIHWLQENE